MKQMQIATALLTNAVVTIFFTVVTASSASALVTTSIHAPHIKMIQTSKMALLTPPQTPTCSFENSERYCRNKTVGSRCQGQHGLGLCTINLDIPNDPYNLPACVCY